MKEDVEQESRIGVHQHDEHHHDDVPQTNLMKPWSSGIWTVNASTTTAPEAETLMVICAIPEGGGAWIWSPLPYSNILSKEIDARCGKVRHITCSNASSSTVVEALVEWSQQYPNAQVLAPLGLADQYPDLPVVIDFILTDDPKREYAFVLDQVVVRGSYSNDDDVVFYHKPSKTVLFGNLLVPDSNQSWFASLSSPTNTTSTAPSEKVSLVTPYTKQLDYWWGGQRDLARVALDKILNNWKPQHLILSSGTTIRGNAKSIIEESLITWVPETKKEGVQAQQPVGEGMLQKQQLTTGLSYTNGKASA